MNNLLFLTIWQTIGDFFKEKISSLISSGIIILIIVVVLLINRWVLGKYGKAKNLQQRKKATIARLLRSINKVIIVFIGVVIVLQQWGIDLGPIIAGAGIIGLAVGFGAQTLVKDLIGGISMVFDDQFDVGDVVDIKGFKGRVIEVGIRSTRVINWKGDVSVFSNGTIQQSINYSKNPSTAVVEVGVAYEETISEVIALLDDRLRNMKDEFPQIIEGPNVMGVISLGASGVIIRITSKTLPEEHYAVERAITKFVKEVFDENGIEIPYDHLVIVDGKANKKLPTE
ncbi:MAG TPA: mechanosensitive ion channel family protein [Acholeplasmataceae bacterium]|nr:mechanosensitive ion channel family protein [Acholeplasmataceae bacterium]